MFGSGSYSYSEVPLGSVNAWSDGFTVDPYADGPSFSYCSSPDHDYIYSPSFTYQQPACHIVSASEVVTKGVDSLSFTTSYIETKDLKYAHYPWLRSRPAFIFPAPLRQVALW